MTKLGGSVVLQHRIERLLDGESSVKPGWFSWLEESCSNQLVYQRRFIHFAIMLVISSCLRRFG